MGYSGAVLAGGRSSRFGRDKARFVWRGRPLLSYVLESLNTAEERLVVAGRDYADFGFPVYPDVIPGGDSLSGLHSALVHARADWVAVAACDLPYLASGYWDYLYERARRTGASAVVAEGPTGWIEPLAAFYRKDLEPVARAQLEAGDLFLKNLVEAAHAEIVPWNELLSRFGPRLFLNANRLEDLVAGADDEASG